MKIAIFAGNCAPFEAKDAAQPNLGAKELGVICLADSLHKQGHELVVLTPAPNPSPSLPVYLPQQAWPQVGPVEVLIAVGEWRAFFLNWKVGRYLYLDFDSLDDFSSYGLADKRVIAKMHALVTNDQASADSFCAETAFPKQKIKVLKLKEKTSSDYWDDMARQIIGIVT